MDAHNLILIDDVIKNFICSSGVSGGLQDPSSTNTGYEKREDFLQDGPDLDCTFLKA